MIYNNWMAKLRKIDKQGRPNIEIYMDHFETCRAFHPCILKHLNRLKIDTSSEMLFRMICMDYTDENLDIVVLDFRPIEENENLTPEIGILYKKIKELTDAES